MTAINSKVPKSMIDQSFITLEIKLRAIGFINSLRSKKQIKGSAFSTERHEKASKEVTDNYNRKSLNITFWNVYGMNQHKIDLFRHKRDEIKNVLDNQDIICLAETWTTQGEEILLWDDP